MKKPVWILFDVGGVLLNWRESSAALASELGVSHDQLLSTMFKHSSEMNVGAISPRDGWRLILHELGSPMTPQAAIEAWRSERFWLPTSLSLVHDLHTAGYKLAILSNSWLGLSIDGHDRTMPVELSLFSCILDSSVEGLKKPDPAFYALAETTTGSRGESLFFVDDDAPNLVPAKAAGWRTYLFDTGSNYGQTAAQELNELLLQD